MRTTAREETNSSALEPENPVRYRMFGRLVTRSPSTCAAVRPSTSADSRRLRESGTSGERPGQPAKRELVAVCPESADGADGCRRKHRVPPLGFTRVHV